MNAIVTHLRDLAATRSHSPERTRVLTALGFVVLTALAAQVAFPVPGSPVPITLQTFVVVLSGVVLGPTMGAMAMVAYLTVGALGLPVFALGLGGLPRLLGPTGGYLVSFPAAAFLAGWVVRGSGAWLRVIAGVTLGTAVIFLGGLGQLALLTGQGLAEVAAVGLMPFLPGAAMKGAAAVVSIRAFLGVPERGD